ncbi:MAG: peptidoglycan DD-metalloendopeptidase family protein [Bacteroidota bacterium]|nr:peptidoglycan DD-metalloendopeptidase family protein [Bacteroidota bacterium]
MKSFSLLVILLILSISASFAQKRPITQLGIPIEGVQNKDWFILNHVDRDNRSILNNDFNCSWRTYDGHTGTDFIITGFNAMDTGVNVLAAADGIVIEIIDTAFDRNKIAIPSKGLGNYIALFHNDSTVTYYSHLKRGSIKVKVGDNVLKGKVLAEVASSGYASDPHLHFELWRNFRNYDPFAGGKCGQVSGNWITRPSIDTTPVIINSGLVYGKTTLAAVQEAFVRQSNWFANQDSFLSVWTLTNNTQKGDKSKFYWYIPLQNGTLTLYDSFIYTHTINSNYFYNWSWTKYPNSSIWATSLNSTTIPEVRYYLNNKLMKTIPFQLKSDITSINLVNPKKEKGIHTVDKDIFLITPNDWTSITILNTEGKVLIQKLNPVDNRINTNLPNGVYIINGITKDNTVINVKIMINK